MKRIYGRIIVLAVLGLLAMGAAPAEAQRDYEPLFDKFNFRFEGSFVMTNTEIRFDSKEHGLGTTLSFEDDLGLDGRTMTPSLSFDWQVGRRHRLGIRWQEVGRNSTAQALTEIEWDGVTIPIDANIDLLYDYETYAMDYTYYPWIKERWAVGFGLGLRTLSILAAITVEGELVGQSGGADFTAPLPYINFEYRRMLGEHWRMKAGLGWLDLTIGDISGSQYIGRLAFEYITDRRWGFGAAINLSTINVDWDALAGGEDQVDLSGHVNFDINDFSLYVRIRFGS